MTRREPTATQNARLTHETAASWPRRSIRRARAILSRSMSARCRRRRRRRTTSSMRTTRRSSRPEPVRRCARWSTCAPPSTGIRGPHRRRRRNRYLAGSWTTSPSACAGRAGTRRNARPSHRCSGPNSPPTRQSSDGDACRRGEVLLADDQRKVSPAGRRGPLRAPVVGGGEAVRRAGTRKPVGHVRRGSRKPLGAPQLVPLKRAHFLPSVARQNVCVGQDSGCPVAECSRQRDAVPATCAVHERRAIADEHAQRRLRCARHRLGVGPAREPVNGAPGMPVPLGCRRGGSGDAVGRRRACHGIDSSRGRDGRDASASGAEPDEPVAAAEPAVDRHAERGRAAGNLGQCATCRVDGARASPAQISRARSERVAPAPRAHRRGTTRDQPDVHRTGYVFRDANTQQRRRQVGDAFRDGRTEVHGGDSGQPRPRNGELVAAACRTGGRRDRLQCCDGRSVPTARLRGPAPREVHAAATATAAAPSSRRPRICPPG